MTNWVDLEFQSLCCNAECWDPIVRWVEQKSQIWQNYMFLSRIIILRLKKAGKVDFHEQPLVTFLIILVILDYGLSSIP